MYIFVEKARRLLFENFRYEMVVILRELFAFLILVLMLGTVECHPLHSAGMAFLLG